MGDEDILIKLPTKLVDKLMPFQKNGVQFAVRKNGRCLIADEMGLGKTLQAIAVAYYYKSEWPLLIVVPSSLRFSWVEELEKWLPDIHPQDVFLVQTSNDASGIQSAKICITTFGLLSKSTSKVIQEALVNQNFQVVIVDESHYIRNFKTVSCKAIVPLIKNANRRVLLSGTPSLSKPVELFPQIDAIWPGKFGNWWAYTARYCDARIEFIGKIRRRSVSGASNLEELQRKLSETLMIRRMKDDVLTQLPPKQRQRVLFDLKDSDVKKDLQKHFDELKSALSKSGKKPGSLLDAGYTESSQPNTLPLIQKLYQLSGEAKIGPARDYVEMLCQNENLKFLLFAYHHSMMNGIQQTLMEKNIKFIRIDGDTKPSERQMYVHQFQSDPETRVAILSILAAGVGLTFTKACLVVFAEMYWTPGVLIQCEDRAHRIGQTGCVSVHYLVAKNTMDEWIWSALCKKTIVTTTTLNGKRQKLKADKGDKYQVDLLSKADAYIPPPSLESDGIDLEAAFSSQQPKDQLSILDFVTSNKKRKLSTYNSNTQKKRSRWSSGDDSIVISDEEESRAISTAETDVLSVSGVLSDWNEKDTSSHSFNNQIVNSEMAVKDSECKLNELKTPNDKKNSKKRGTRRSVISPSTDRDDQDFVDSPKYSSMSKIRNKTKISDQDLQRQNEMAKTPNLLVGLSQCRTKKNKISAQWNCLSCTFLNHADLPFCEVCDTPRKSRGVCETVDDDQKSNNLQERSPDCKGHLDVSDIHSSTPNQISGRIMYVDPTDRYETNCKSVSSVNISDTTTGRTSHHFPVNDVLDESLNSDHDSSYSEHFVRKKKVRKSFQLGTKICVRQKVQCGSEEVLAETFMKRDLECTRVLCDQYVETEYPIAENDDVKDTQKDIKGNWTKTSVSSPSCRNSIKNQTIPDRLVTSSDVSKQQTNQSKPSSVCHMTVADTSTLTQDNIIDEVNSDTEIDFESDSKDLTEKSLKDQHEVRLVDMDKVKVYKLFQYCCSKYTNRVYLFDQGGSPLNVNFLPLDIDLGNHDSLPDLLLHPHNLKIIQKFLREWNSLTETKKKLIIKSGQVFVSPLCVYDQIKSGTSLSVQRHKTKEDTAALALAGAQHSNGSIRQISKSKFNFRNPTDDSSIQESPKHSGVLQAVDADGVPLCLHCSKPYTNNLLQKKTITSAENAWVTRFCSQTCMDTYWLQTNSQYCRDKVFEAEHGVCQICKFDAHSFYKQLRDTMDKQKRVQLLHQSPLDKLSAKQKKKMVEHPVAGQFWHVDHIRPVWEGGGVCDIDNFRTLCVTCHQKVTADQAKNRAQVKRLEEARGMGDITAFFKVAKS